MLKPMRKTIIVNSNTLYATVEHDFSKIKRVKESKEWFDVSCHESGVYEIVANKLEMTQWEIMEVRDFCKRHNIKIQDLQN